MQLIFKKSFVKQYNNLESGIKQKTANLIEKLRQADNLSEIENVKKIKDNYYRIRIGNYRLGIEYRNPELVIVTIVKRDERTYKDFPPK